jgi:hypothetical protein
VADDGADLAIDAPMDKQAEAQVAEPFQPLRAVIGKDSGGNQAEDRAQP